MAIKGTDGMLLVYPVRFREVCVCESSQDVAAVNSQCANLMTTTIMLPSPFGIPKGVGMAHHSHPGISGDPQLQLYIHLGLSSLHNTWIIKFQFTEEHWSPGLWQPSSARAGFLLITHTLIHTLFSCLVGLLVCVCVWYCRETQEGRERIMLQPQLLMSILAANYCSSSSASKQLRKNSPPFSLPPPHPHPLLWVSKSDLPSDERWLPSCNERKAEEGWFKRGMKVEGDEGADSLYAA